MSRRRRRRRRRKRRRIRKRWWESEGGTGGVESGGEGEKGGENTSLSRLSPPHSLLKGPTCEGEIAPHVGS